MDEPMSHGTLQVHKQTERVHHFYGPNINPQVIYSSGPEVYDTYNHALRIKSYLKEAPPLVYALRSLDKRYANSTGTPWHVLAI